MKKSVSILAVFIFIFVLLGPIITSAQPLNINDITAQMVKEWERAKAYTVD